MQWAAHFRQTDSGRYPHLRWGQRRHVLMFCLCVGACGSVHDRGVEAANAMLDSVGVGAAEMEQTVSRNGDLYTELQSTAFGREIRAAVVSDPAVIAQRSELEGVEARLDALTGSLRPQVSAGLTAGQDLLASGDSPSLDARLTLSQLIFDGATTRNRISLARINRLQVGFELDVLLSALSLQMARAWLDVWQRGELLTLAQEDVDVHLQFVEQTQQRAAGGIGADSDLFSARSRLADVQADLAQAASSFAQAQATYFSLFGRMPDDAERPARLPALSSEAARDRISTSSRMIRSRLNLAEALGQQAVTVSARYPALSLEVTGARTDVFSSSAENDAFVGFSIDQSLFSGGQQRAREREAESGVAAAERGLEDAERGLRRLLEIAIARRAAAAVESGAATDSVRFNEASLNAVREQFAIGRRSIVDILDAQRDLSAARARRLSVLASEIDAELAILELTGDLAAAFGIEYDPFLDTFDQPAGNIPRSADAEDVGTGHQANMVVSYDHL